MKRTPVIALYAVLMTAALACQTTQETRTEQDRRAEEWRRSRKGHYTTILNGKHLPFDYTRYNLVVFINRGYGTENILCGSQLIDELYKLLQADGTYKHTTATGSLNIEVFIDSCKFRQVRAGTTTHYDRQGYWAGTSDRYETEWSVSGYLMFGGRTFGNFYNRYIGSNSRELYRRTAKGLLVFLLPVKQRVYVSDDPRDAHYKELMDAAGDTGKFAALLARGRDPNASTWDGKVLLHSLIGRDHRAGNTTDLVRLLLDKGANPGIKDINGYTPLHMAAVRKDPALLDLLITRGAPVNAKTADGDTPLTRALNVGNREVAVRLLEKGAVVDQNSQLYSLKSRDASLAALLKKYPKEKFTAVPGEKLLTAIKRNSKDGYEDALTLIQLVGVDYGGEKQRNETVTAALSAYLDKVSNGPPALREPAGAVLSALLEKGLTLTSKSYDPDTLLTRALEKDDAAAARLALKLGASANKSYIAPKGRNYLPRFTKARSVEMIRAMADHGANLQFKGPGGESLPVLFLKLGWRWGKAPDREAWEKSIPGVIMYLVDRSFDPNEGMLLNECCKSVPSPALVEFLIKKGARVNDRERWSGRTPLHTALFWKNVEVVPALLKHGAKVNEKATDGKTPLAVAREMEITLKGKPDRKLIERKQRAIALLKQYGAR